jgi:hypothetical protein
MVDSAYALIFGFIVIATALGIVGAVGAIFDIIDLCTELWRKYKWLQRNR